MTTGNDATQPVPEPPDTTPHPQGLQGRDGAGRFTRSLEGAERDRYAAEQHAKGYSYKEIAAELGVHKSQAIRAVQRAVRAVVQDAGEQVLRLHMDRLEYLYGKAVEIAEADHVVVSHGKVITMPGEDGVERPLKDHGPTLAALREARASLESFRRLVGMDKPAKVEHSGGVTYQVVGVDPEDLA